jgi:hypothetical protein
MGLNSEFFVNLGLKSKGFEKGLKDAGKDVDKFANTISDYGSVIQEQKDITIEFEKELRRLETALKNTSKGNLAQQKSLKDGITNIKAAIGDQRLALKDLNNQQGKNNVTTKTFSNNLARNYGAIQLLDKVTGGLASELRAVEDATKLFNVSLNGTKKALIATGIGIFIIALGVVVNYWDDIKGAISGADDSLIELNKTASETVTTFNALADAVLTAFEFDGLIDSADGLKNIRKEFKDLDDAIKELEATGQDNEANVSGLINKYREYIVVQEKLKKALDDIQKLDPGQDDFKVQQGKLKDLISSLFTQRNVLRDIFEVEKKTSQIKSKKRPKEDSLFDDVVKIKQKEDAFLLFAEQKFQDAFLAIQKRTSELGLVLRRDASEEALNQISQFQEDLNNLVSAETLSNGLSGIGEGIGNAIAEGGNVIQAAGNAALSALGSFIAEMGKLLIKYGTLAVIKGTLDTAIAAGGPLSIAAGIAAIAVGTALTAAGTAIGGLASSGGGAGVNGASNSSGGGVSSTTFSGSGSGGDFNGRVVFEIAGDKLIGVLNNTSLGNLRVGDNNLITTG